LPYFGGPALLIMLRLSHIGAKEAQREVRWESDEALSSKAIAETPYWTENKRIPKRSAVDPRIEKALQSSARKLPDRKLASEPQTVTAPASLSSEGGKA